MKSNPTPLKAYMRGSLAVAPLALAVAPWGLLAGSMAIESGLSESQSIGMSIFMFAGAAQLAVLSMLNAGAGMVSILLTVALITSRHLLYSLSMRDTMRDQAGRWRYGLGFLLTDEFFAIMSSRDKERLNLWYAFGVGFSFYLIWVLCTALGVFLGRSIPNLSSLGLDFSIAATFLAIIVPLVKDTSTTLCVLVALVCSVVFTQYDIQPALLLAGVSGMTAGFITRKYFCKQS